MAQHTIGLQNIYLEMIKSGQKLWEGRLCNDKYSAIKVGDRVIMDSGLQKIDVEIEERRKYSSFAAMLRDEGVQAFLPNNGDDLEGAIEVYRKFPGYREGEELFGAVAFRIKVLD